MIKLSASAIAAFKACPYRYYIKYVLGIRLAEDTESQRIGSTWHKCLQILGQEPESVCRECAEKSKPSADCIFCRGKQYIPKDRLSLAVRYLEEKYSNIPDYMTPEECRLEYVKLLYCLYGYNWYWGQNDFSVIINELQFSIPVREPDTNRVMLNCEINGRIDKIVKNTNDMFMLVEHKSTSKPIDSGSSVWNRLRLDTQKKLYTYTIQQLQLSGELDYIIEKDSPLLTGCFYDFFHKPTIKPKKLSQADTKKFIETGKYYDEEFLITQENDTTLKIDDETADIEPGKKEGMFSIRETPIMYGCRLLYDIKTRPEFYFARREIPTTESDIEQFKVELYNILRTIKQMKKTNSWFHNESQCEATFKCPFTSFCYNGVEPDVNSLPDKFKCIYKGDKE